MKVLVADDSTFMRNILKDILVKGGWSGAQVIEAGNGNEAIDRFNAEKPDLVLLDIIMPEKDGIQVLKEIGQEANVVVISAIGQENMIEEAKALGVKDYIVKPFDSAKVVETLKAVIGESSAETS